MSQGAPVTDKAIRDALKEQYHGALAMLTECVEKCPDAIWGAGVHPRQFWRIAAHAAYFAHLYLVQRAVDFDGSGDEWPAGIRNALGLAAGRKPTAVEPYELPEGTAAISRADLIDYIGHVDKLVDATLDELDLASADTGFSWYPNMNKLSHEIMNLRHIQGHTGQLSELLMANGIDTRWVSRSRTAAT